MTETRKSFPIETHVPDNLPIYYVHGLSGGIGPTGELMGYLYEDGPRMPRAFQAEVSSDGGTRLSHLSPPLRNVVYWQS